MAFATGMAAAATVIEAPPGDRESLSQVGLCRGSPAARRARGAGRDRIEARSTRATKATIAALEGADVLWLDAITNPQLEVAELDLMLPAARRAAGHEGRRFDPRNAPLLRPFELGADLVVHSATKYIGGHSDLMLGAAVCRDPRLAARLRDRGPPGAVPGTMEAWLGLRGLRTLPLRVERAGSTAGPRREPAPGIRGSRGALSELKGEPPSREAAPRLLDGFGALVSFEVAAPGAPTDLLRDRGDLPRQQPRRGRKLIERRAPGTPSAAYRRLSSASASGAGPGGPVAGPRAGTERCA